jgi:enoyl-CoA hydratase/carnithine racemase
MADVEVERQERIVHIRFNRPEKKNALTTVMYAAARDALASVREDDDVRVILISGAGETFCAGNDLNDFMSALPQPGEESPVQGFLREISTCEKIVVAAVQGAAIGVGTTMLLHCDLVVASETASFKTPFVDLGLVPEAASSLLLPQLIGHQRAAKMFLLGEDMTATEALNAGLVTFLMPSQEVFERAQDLAQRLAKKAPNALRLSKRLMKGDSAAIANRMAEEGTHFAAQLQSAELREAVLAFAQKRPADFG